MTTEAPNKTKIFRKKKGSDEDVITKMTKHLQKKFPKRELEVKIASDDGGRLIEIHVNEPKLSKSMRDFLPLNWEGWRTVVINRYAASGAE
jgi:hypothetical protein